MAHVRFMTTTTTMCTEFVPSLCFVSCRATRLPSLPSFLILDYATAIFRHCTQHEKKERKAASERQNSLLNSAHFLPLKRRFSAFLEFHSKVRLETHGVVRLVQASLTGSGNKPCRFYSAMATARQGHAENLIKKRKTYLTTNYKPYIRSGTCNQTNTKLKLVLLEENPPVPCAV